MSINFKALIFGSGGQDGYYLSKLLNNRKIDPIGISIDNADVIGDISEYDFVFNQIKKYNPIYIFHLAAFSTTRHDAIFKNHLSISTGTLNILEAVRILCPETKVFIAGSAMQFENIGLPIDEKTPFDPSSAYSVARIHSVFASRYYQKEFGLKVYIGYLFNHDSPLRPESHINQKIVRSVKRIAAGSVEKLELGSIDIKKEFNYAADIVEAIWILINQDKVFEAVIGSGEAHSIREWAEYCFSNINKRWQDYVILNENYVSEYNILVSNPAIIKSLGWIQKVNFKQLADLMMSENKY